MIIEDNVLIDKYGLNENYMAFLVANFGCHGNRS